VRLLKVGFFRPSITLVFLVVAAFFIRGARIESYLDIGGTLLTLGLYALFVPVFVLDGRDKGFLLGLYRNRKVNEL
jgi:hypothetical protein